MYCTTGLVQLYQFMSGCGVSIRIAPLGWCSYIISFPAAGSAFTTGLVQLYHFIFFGCWVSSCITPLGWCSYIILFLAAGSAFVLHHWAGAGILCYFWLPGQHSYCTTGLVPFYHFISGHRASFSFAPLCWCSYIFLFLAVRPRLVLHHWVGAFKSISFWPWGHGVYCATGLAPLHQFMSGRRATYLLSTLKSCLLCLHLCLFKVWITWFSGVRISCGVWVAAKGSLAGLFWTVWVVAFCRALWREIIFLSQSPTIKDWFSPGSKGRQSL